jgi:2,6-dihydroxypyridine 3-monooxygenase
MTPPLKVAIAGGSMGGLTAALLLRDQGHDVTVYERSSEELQQRGAGIGFLPDSYRYLVERAGRSLEDLATVTHDIRYLDRRDRVVVEVPCTYHFSSWNTVYRNLLAEFGRERYLLGCEVVGRDESEDSVTVRFADGSTVEADLLVAADGVGSAFRQELLPEVQHQYAGYVAWRGMVPERDLPSNVVAVYNDSIVYYVYANSHILLYPIPGPDGAVTRGERLVNFVWYRNYSSGDDLHDLMTDAGGTHRDISLPPGAVRAEHVREMQATAAARLPGAIAAVVCAAEAPFLQVVYDVEVSNMAFGRTCLIGDAGFVARPHAAAGTAKAAANAWALADALRCHDEVRSALAEWEVGQLELGRQLLARTRRVGTRSQFTGDWDPHHPDVFFRLREDGV